MPVWDIGLVEPIPERAACPLCQIFLDTSPRENQTSHQRLSLFEMLGTENAYRSPPTAKRTSSHIFLANIHHSLNSFNRATGRMGFIEVLNRNRPGTSGPLVRRVHPTTANLDIVKLWLQDCSKHHACALKSHVRAPRTHFKFLDCVTRCITARQVKKFVPLNYA